MRVCSDGEKIFRVGMRAIEAARTGKGEEPGFLTDYATIMIEYYDTARDKTWIARAHEILDMALARDTAHVEARYQKARLLRAQGARMHDAEAIQRSIDLLEEGLKIRPGNARLLVGLARSYGHLAALLEDEERFLAAFDAARESCKAEPTGDGREAWEEVIGMYVHFHELDDAPAGEALPEFVQAEVTP